MIETVADFLQQLLDKEKEVLSRQKITHRPTIGNMYEGLTAEVLQQGLFKGLNLRLCTSSFIRNNQGELTGELDVVLAVGEGEPIPYTTQYIYKPEQVVAVFQVKKKLFSKDMVDSYLNLRNVVSVYAHETIQQYQGELLRDAFTSICRKDITTESRKNYNDNEEHIFYVLKHEAIMPVRIVLGYDGFKKENNLRNSFIDYIEENITTDLKNKKKGFGPANLPSLIVCRNFSILKNNGMPFGFPMTDGMWNVLFTTNEKPVYFMLEYIWTRLSYMYSISSDIFGEDLIMEQVIRFLDCRVTKIADQSAWHYQYFPVDDDFLANTRTAKDWGPVFLDEAQFHLINYLLVYGSVSLASKFISDLDKDQNTSIDKILEHLLTSGLAFTENGEVKLLNKGCACAALPDGRFVAGENISGRLSRWLTNNLKRQ